MVFILLMIVITGSTYLNLLIIQQTITLESGCDIFLLLEDEILPLDDFT